MILITRESKAAGVAETYARQYRDLSKEFRLLDGRNPHAISLKLNALGANPDPDAVDAAIESKGWTQTTCNECNQDVDVVVQLGQEPDCESATANVCMQCLASAVRLAGKLMLVSKES